MAILIMLHAYKKMAPTPHLPDPETSDRLLHEIKERLRSLIQYCLVHHHDNENVHLLRDRFKPENVRETSWNEQGTSFIVEKGEEMHLCLRDKKTFKHHNINILMFVAIHELAHVMSSSFGHNEEFRLNFKFLLQNAVDSGIYTAENYNQSPVNFCGIKVTSTPLFPE